MDNRLIAYATAGSAEIPEADEKIEKIEENKIEYYSVGSEFVIVDIDRAGCTCSSVYLICSHILSVISSEYPSNTPILTRILKRLTET